MTLSADIPPRKPRSLLSKATDVAIYAGIAGTFALLLTRGSSGPSEGGQAKGFELPLASGTGSFDLAAQRGKPVLLEVFASWCGACRHAAPMLGDVYREAKSKDVVFVGVAVDGDRAEALRVQREWPIEYPIAVDNGRVQHDYGVSLLPTFVLIDRDGTIKHVNAGVPARRTLSRWLAEL